MINITTHVLDVSAGKPAAGIPVTLEFRAAATQPWVMIGDGDTDKDGRVFDLLPADHVLEMGLYRLRFDISGVSPFFPEVSIQFRVTDVRHHYHLPLLLSPFGYSTYRGS
jgi:5-hydroxyisourate hydrolase